MSKYIIILEKSEKLETFVNGNKFFNLNEAKDFIKHFIKMYPKNDGFYKIYEVKENIQ